MTPQTLTANDVFGTNTQAQDILKQIVGEKFPNIEATDGVTSQIINKYYDYHFPYYMGEENASIRRWENAVRAWCFRNKKLEVVEAYYNANGTTSDFKEVYTGEDTTTDTDTQTRRQVETNTGEDVTTEVDTQTREQVETPSGADVTVEVDTQSHTTTEKYNSINTPSSKTSGITETAGTGGTRQTTTTAGTTRTTKTTGTGGNRQTTAKAGTTRTTEYTGTGGTLNRVYKRGTTRTYSDGRTWGQVLDDVTRITAPVYDFINGFGALLVSPYTPACDPWLYGTTAAAVGNVTMLPAGSPAKVTVNNEGSPLNALYKFNFELPKTEVDQKYFLHSISFSIQSGYGGEEFHFLIYLQTNQKLANVNDFKTLLPSTLWRFVWGFLIKPRETAPDNVYFLQGFYFDSNNNLLFYNANRLSTFANINFPLFPSSVYNFKDDCLEAI